jgi:hypothetical protein
MLKVRVPGEGAWIRKVACPSSFTRGNEVFEATQPDENIAVCLAALQTVGWVFGGPG